MQELEPLKIVSLVRFNDELSFILNRMPKFEYEYIGDDTLWGQDGDFISRFGYHTPSKAFEAFGGREFSIPMKNGTTIEANGQWWDDNTKEVEEHLGCQLVRVSCSTMEKLNECFVFFGGYFLPVDVHQRMIDEYMQGTESVIHSYDTLRDSLRLRETSDRLNTLYKEITKIRTFSERRHENVVRKVKEQHKELERLRKVETNYKEVMLLKFEELVFGGEGFETLEQLMMLLIELGVSTMPEMRELLHNYSRDKTLPNSTRVKLIDIHRKMY